MSTKQSSLTMKPVELAEAKEDLIRFREKMAELGYKYQPIGLPVLVRGDHDFSPDDSSIQRVLAELNADGGLVLDVVGEASPEAGMSSQACYALQPYRLEPLEDGDR